MDAGAGRDPARSRIEEEHVMDAGGTPAPAPQAPDCSGGQGAYEALVAIVSADTGTSVQTIAGKLRAGSSLDDVAGPHQGEVRQQAVALVDGWLRFAVANGRLTQRQAAVYSALAAGVIDALMAADVSSCVPG